MYCYEVPPRGSPRLEAPTKEEVLEIIRKEREAKRSALARQATDKQKKLVIARNEKRTKYILENEQPRKPNTSSGIRTRRK